MNTFLNVMSPSPEEKILDVGGTIFNWELVDYKHSVTLLNLAVPEKTNEHHSNFEYVSGDGTSLSYDNNEYDICFSNSVIEHTGSFDNQKKFAQEACRVGKKLWLQTPAKSFFLDPHTITPFIHWLPRKIQKLLLRNFSIWGLIARPTQEYVDEYVDQTRFLTYKEIKEIFPECKIKKEKFLLMTKAFLAIKDKK